MDDFINMIDECVKLLDENANILNDIDYSLQSEKEDVVVTDLTKNDLVDMAHEVSDSTRIKKAEYDFVRRLLEKNSD
ncbi:hypothetical protein [Candidatus Nitrosotalea bavarica]|jgi:hypothetical protein|uniref:hypothetical protein n=1 Tax=Candidatus Nitrosotalea bavarica TaxID=1903277 RepID=UPI000C712810|nr:hypothetical protein [Candidatus Nitrosotalea bavarica]